jgi:hypothetical protein
VSFTEGAVDPAAARGDEELGLTFALAKA